MKNMTACLPVTVLMLGLVACGGSGEGEGRKVDTSGKESAALDAVPAQVLQAAYAARPEFVASEAEYETRDGNEYWDIEGTLPDGSELEMDMTRIDGVWTVVEFQRDVEIDGVPEAVQATLGSGHPGWAPIRIIESDQGNGVVIYEFFGKTETGEDTKIEVKWAQGIAELLNDEWAH